MLIGNFVRNNLLSPTRVNSVGDQGIRLVRASVRAAVRPSQQISPKPLDSVFSNFTHVLYDSIRREFFLFFWFFKKCPTGGHFEKNPKSVITLQVKLPCASNFTIMFFFIVCSIYQGNNSLKLNMSDWRPFWIS